MAFITGQATTLQGILDALTTAIAANGWTASGNVWSKNGCFVSFEILSITPENIPTTLRLRAGTGVSGGALDGAAIYGQAMVAAARANAGIVFPATYAIHINTDPDEVYCFVNYNVTYYQWLAFGRSPVAGLPGTGNWAGGTVGINAAAAVYAGVNQNFIGINLTSQWGATTGVSPAALFWSASGINSTNIPNCSSVFHHGISGDGWTIIPSAALAAAPRIQYGLSTWNQDAPLFPIRPILSRESSKYSVIGELKHARYLRIDNYAPGEIITLGQDKWRAYPWHQKNSAARDGGNGVNHTGTLGVALRYDGA